MDDTLGKFVEIAQNYPVIKRMWIFGSRYKNTHKEDSDLDIAVEVEWVEGQHLGIGSEPFGLWSRASCLFEDEMKAACNWKLDLQWYGGENETPNIHKYLEDCSKLFYEK